MPTLKKTNLLLLTCLFFLSTAAQPITGTWQGKINKKRVEVKIIQKGDSLTGTSYYFDSPKNYTRYSIKGYFDASTNSAVWWDDQLIGGAGGRREGQHSVADFNCPGGGKMFLDGEATPTEDRGTRKGPVALTKVSGPQFQDEWDYVIDNYTVGANNPDVIDSVRLIAARPRPEQPAVVVSRPSPVIPAAKPEVPPIIAAVPAKPQTIEEKYTTRRKVVSKEIPVWGDSVELRFYDNAQVDGDSISLFLNGKILFTHIRLTDKAHTIKLATKDLKADNELVMVAENLGAIPPNTSYMVALVGDKRYEAQLASTENSSAVIRMRKE